jgi:hypothetical protein
VEVSQDFQNQTIYTESFIENEDVWEEKIEKYVVYIPKGSSKEDLMNLKKFMEELSPWDIKIYIHINEREIYTKINLADIESLKNWEKNNLISI